MVDNFFPLVGNYDLECCTQCGAVVLDSRMDDHEKWHEHLDRTLNEKKATSHYENN
jgi:hypothetical protein